MVFVRLQANIKNSRIWICFGILVALLAADLLSAPIARAQDSPPAPVETAIAMIQPVSPSIWVPGTVVSRQDSRIAAEVEGSLLSVLEVGDRVKKGEAIAQIDETTLQLQLRDDRASIRRLKSNLAFISRQVDRVQKLASTNNTAESELDQLQMQKQMLAEQVTMAEVKRDRTLFDIERSTIKAPFNGIIVSRTLQPGEYITKGDVVVRLVNIDNIEVKAQAPVSVSRYVKENSTVGVKNDVTTAVTPIRRVVPVGDERSRMLEVRVKLTKGLWVIGEAVRVELANGISRQLLTVPRDALILRDQQIYLYKITADNVAKRIPIKAGDGVGKYISITGAVREGDTVVVRGGERLRDGQSVNVTKSRITTL